MPSTPRRNSGPSTPRAGCRTPLGSPSHPNITHIAPSSGSAPSTPKSSFKTAGGSPNHQTFSRVSPVSTALDRDSPPPPLHELVSRSHHSIIGRARPGIVNPLGQKFTYFDDDVRFRELRPMQPRYNVNFDQALLLKYYNYLGCCAGCCLGPNVQRTYMDIYPNKIELNSVSGCCFGYCCVKDHPRVVHYDRSYFREPPKRASCMSPCFPFPCINFCDICGEVLVFDSGCRRDNTDIAPGFNHWTNCLCNVAAIYGLPEGEAAKVAEAVMENVEGFEELKRGML